MAHDLPLLQLAFTVHMAEQIFGSDLDVDEQEAAWLADTFPLSVMQEAGLVDDAGARTPRYEELRDRAVVELPDALDEVHKLAVLEVLVGAAAADGVLCAEESMALAHAAQLLGVPHDHWVGHLDELLASGAIQRDDAGA